MSDLFAARAGKLFKMLSSPVDAEALAGCRAFSRYLAEAKLDWHWAADILEAAWPTNLVPKPPPKEPNPRMPWQQQAETLLRDHRDVLGWRDGKRFDATLRTKEIDFLINVRKSRFAPSPGQQKWLGDIASRTRRAA
jgi:hypothetical protein